MVFDLDETLDYVRVSLKYFVMTAYLLSYVSLPLRYGRNPKIQKLILLPKI